MEGPRACKIEERDKVLNLINKTFRTPRGYNPSMGEEFKLLLGEKNLEGMRIILEGEEPVANVNFYKSTVLIEGIPVKVASIGAVCTEKDSRGNGYSSLLLDDSERLMKKAGVRLMLVSGTRSLYTRRGCALAGRCYEFTIEPSEKKPDNIHMEEFCEDKLPVLTKLYNMESTRFYRSFEEFGELLSGATTPWANFTYKTYVIKSSNEYCAYLVLRIINSKEGTWGSVVEAAGDRKIVIKALEEAIRINSLTHVQYFCTFNDASAEVLMRENNPYKELNLLGSVKVLDFEGLMKDLRPYFSQYLDKEVLNNIEFKEKNNKFLFMLKDEVIEFKDLQQLSTLIFGSKDNIHISFDNKPLLDKFFKAVFPLPFVWTANLNYQ